MKSLLILLTLHCLLFADQIVFKNGDRVSGRIVKKAGGKITIASDMFGSIETDWDKIASVTADKPLNVVLPDGRTVLSTLATTDGKVDVVADGAKISLPPEAIQTLRDDATQKEFERLQRPGWLDLWAGTGSIGFAGALGNARTTTFTTGFNAARVTRTDKSTVYFNTIRASALSSGKSAETAQAVRGGIGYSRNLKPRLFANVFNDYEYDKFQNLDLRSVFGGGLGYKAISRDRLKLEIPLGAAYNISQFTTFTRKTGEFYWGNDLTFKLNGATSFVQGFRMFNDIQSPGNYRINFDISANTKLSKWLNWNVSISDRYLTNPSPGRKTNDLLYTTGLGISFAR